MTHWFYFRVPELLTVFTTNRSVQHVEPVSAPDKCLFCLHETVSTPQGLALVRGEREAEFLKTFDPQTLSANDPSELCVTWNQLGNASLDKCLGGQYNPNVLTNED